MSVCVCVCVCVCVRVCAYVCSCISLIQVAIKHGLGMDGVGVGRDQTRSNTNVERGDQLRRIKHLEL